MSASVAPVLSPVAFLGGLIHYASENNRIARDYLVNYTNAAFIVKEGLTRTYRSSAKMAIL